MTTKTKLADVQHEIWSHWMRYLFGICTENEDGTVTIPADKAERWRRQANTRYRYLSEEEQKSDLEQAEKVLTVLENPG